VSPFEKKKKSKSTAGTAHFLKGIGRSLTSDTVDLVDLEESAKKAEAMAAKIKSQLRQIIKMCLKNMCRADHYSLLRN
jgi:SH3-like domain-containing protein